MANRNLEKMASIDAHLRLLVPAKVSEDDKLVEYDALLLDRFLDILQDLHGEDLKETVRFSVFTKPLGFGCWPTFSTMCLNFVVEHHVVGLVWKSIELYMWWRILGTGLSLMVWEVLRKQNNLCNGILRGYVLVILVLTFSFCFKCYLLPSNLAVDSLVSILWILHPSLKYFNS